MTRTSLIITITALILLTGCRNDDNTVPRRYAYPRIELYDTIYKHVITSPVNIEVNSSALAEISHRSIHDTWINVRYPRYHATLSLTLIETSDDGLKEALRNRNERMSLNLNGINCRTYESTHKDMSGIVLVAESPCVTPVQILATDHQSLLLTGALTFDGDKERTVEEISPVVNAVKEDLLHMFNHLSYTGND